MTAPITRVAVYYRVSSDEQARNETIDAQITYLRRYCEFHNLTIIEEYADNGISGAIPLGQRPAGQKLLADARDHRFDLVLTLNVKRMSRGRLIYLLQTVELLESLGVGYKSAMEEFSTATAMGRMILSILGSFAEMDREDILERTYSGKVRVAAKNKFPGGRLPMGYRLNDEGHPIIYESEAEIVRRAFRLYGSGMSLLSVCAILNAEGSLFGTGSLWTESSLMRTLASTTYGGRYRYGKLSITCPAIVTPEEQEAVQATRDRNRRMSTRNAKRLYLLRGLVTCGTCGSSYVGRDIGSGTKGSRYAYYFCWSRKRGEHCGPHVRTEDLETRVWDEVCTWIRHPEEVIERFRARLRESVTDGDALEAELGTIERPLGQMDAERSRIFTLFRKNLMNERDLTEQLAAIDAERATLVDRREQLATRLAELQQRETAIMTAEQTLRGLQGRINVAETADKTDIIHLLVKQVLVYPGKPLRIEIIERF